MAKTSESTKKTCFVISPIGDEGSATRNRADLVYEFVISAVLTNQPFDYVIERADKLGAPGIITNQIIDRVVEADLVIADLSERNPNVFYELATRHIAQKPFVHVISQNEDIPFDTAAARAIYVDVSDLRSVDRAKRELATQVISATHDGAISESPISTALTLKSMKTTDTTEASLLGDLLNQMSILTAAVQDVKRTQANLGVHKSPDLRPMRPSDVLGGALGSLYPNTIEDALRGAKPSPSGGLLSGQLDPLGSVLNPNRKK